MTTITTNARRLTILYGSQTGTAQDVAERIARDAKRRHFSVDIAAMDDYDRRKLLTAGTAIFVCSTMGQGEEPDNMKSFWRFLLLKAHSSTVLANLQFTVFALGDSSYDKFNHPGKKLYKRLQQLGASSIFAKGEADDQHYLGIDGTLDPWLNGLWQILMQQFPLPPGFTIVPEETLLPPRYRLVPASDEPHLEADPHRWLGDDAVMGTLSRNDRLTATDHFQDVRHISITLPAGTTYQPGDVAMVMPETPPDRITEALDVMGWTAHADVPVRVESNDPDYAVPAALLGRTTTLRQLLARFLSPFSPPRRYLFRLLSHFAADPQQHEKLVEFDSAAGQDDLIAYCVRPRRHCVEVVRDFFSVSGVPVNYAMDLFPHMAPRQYSIASAPSADPPTIDLAVAMVDYSTSWLAAPRMGIATAWLRDLPVGTALPVRIHRGTFVLPPDPATPVILVGPGTGVAPMMSLIDARLGTHGASSTPATFLYFGCRSQTADDLWTVMRRHSDRKDPEAAASQLTVRTAYSRDQPAKVYVQHLILQDSPMVFDLVVHRGAWVYLSGSSKQMPADIRDTLTTIVQTGAKWTREQAIAYVEQMRRERRFQEETWS
ncbi:NADPH-dependent diflavin oxidoreductase 1 [Blastocladiella britannica]|nr:NADPH-dependent diflavin oxidoreductase 1 [Blastocladiella britannica]